jgi:hypothetical protein
MNDAIEAASRHPEPERPQLHARAASRPKRASRGLVRVWAWTLGGLSFLSPLALFGVFPKPAQAAAATSSTSAIARSSRPVVVVITKKIIYTKSASSSVTSSGVGPVNYVVAPAAAPVATTCGTHPC